MSCPMSKHAHSFIFLATNVKNPDSQMYAMEIGSGN